MNGREAGDVEPVLAATGDVGQYIFCSSAGVYLKSDQMPHQEEDATDPSSRHKARDPLPRTPILRYARKCIRNVVSAFISADAAAVLWCIAEVYVASRSYLHVGVS